MAPDASGKIIGTPGPDVIVSDQEYVVDAGAGNDLICFVGRRVRGDEWARGDAGPGDDVVDATGTLMPVTFVLGTGADTFQGGPGPTEIYAATADYGIPDLADHDAERDVITTGDAADWIHSGSPSSTETPWSRTRTRSAPVPATTSWRCGGSTTPHPSTSGRGATPWTSAWPRPPPRRGASTPFVTR